MASGYVAGSAVLFPQWQFALVMGDEQIPAFAPNPRFAQRHRNPSWEKAEERERQELAHSRELRASAQRAYDEVMARGVVDDDF